MGVGLLSTSLASGLSRESLRNQIFTSLFGRRCGMDSAGYEVGEQDTRLPIDLISSTASGQTLSPNGFSLLASSTGGFAISLTGAVPGIYKQITQISSATGSSGFAVQFGTNAQIISSLGSSYNQILFAGLGHTANLTCVASGTSVGSSVGGGGLWLITTTFTTAGGMSLSTY